MSLGDRESAPSHVENQLASISIGRRVRGLVPNQVVEITAVAPMGPSMVQVAFRGQDGIIREQVLEKDIDIEIVMEDEPAYTFDGNPDTFKLASEAMRIKYAALYDPLAAVNSSDVDPLPHQIRAVYEELLPRVPLRFLLADDPGAGKTIMAGLYIKELTLRSACDRAIIVAPGGLVEQWREELEEKFGLHFEIFHRAMIEASAGGNAFADHPYLIVRMDQVARNEDLFNDLGAVTWDVAVVDEAHRMSAHHRSWAGEVDKTARFELGRLLSQTAQHFLLMTATPHAGKDEDFQLFMSLLDPDRFEGEYRPGAHRTDTDGLMRRMVKEDLLTFEGKPLFPERRAYTVTYDLSPAERNLYEQVTTYVREEMGRAERMLDKKRGNTIGFALTVLQRRLASSPEAILRSLERRRARLQNRLEEIENLSVAERKALRMIEAVSTVGADKQSKWDDPDELSIGEFEELEREIDDVVDLATAAQTVPELQAEIATLDELVRVAMNVRSREEDTKWVQLRTILDKEVLGKSTDDIARKIIIFTEHRDTLNYLERQIATQLGRDDAVITIHGGTGREERKRAQESFTNDPSAMVLLATDAAGEGLNLQRAHLMVNYDLPWNPNRIEQRFGRIHRIGQREVCHLWNLVAADTREGDVFTRLLTKIDAMSTAYNGNLFNVLGEGDAFEQRSLRDLLLDAIRYGDQPEVKKKLDQIIDSSVSQGLDELMQNHGLERSIQSQLDIEELRRQMEEAKERRLQPGFIAAFFIPAFERLGGRIKDRRDGTYEIRHVPSSLIHAARAINPWNPVTQRYERVTFDLDRVSLEGGTKPTLLAPGHPLLGVVIEETIKRDHADLTRGTVLVDRRDAPIAGTTLIFIVEQRIVTGNDTSVSHHFDYVLLEQDGSMTLTKTPPFLDFDAPTDEELSQVQQLFKEGFVPAHHENTIKSFALREGAVPRKREVAVRRDAELGHTRSEVEERLKTEINHWATEMLRLQEEERAGRFSRLTARRAEEKVADLQDRLDRRLVEIDASRQLAIRPAIVVGAALVVPASLVAPPEKVPDTFVLNTEETERRAVDAVIAAERALGRLPEEQDHYNPGFDIRSYDDRGIGFFIEVKGRVEGADTFTITSMEVNTANTQKAQHRLALVRVSPLGPDHDEVRYVDNAFSHIQLSATTQSMNEKWRDYWSRGSAPH
ncbi:helicase-related protein [Corynebacterium sp. Q4381]|uniref:helicase-related protein n=1 Tax=Corynebacterium sp. Marseille-Q4381 TaxID=3121597 RepID=UPI002FE683CF